MAWLGELEENRARILLLAQQRMNPLLLRRLSPEDVVQTTFANALRRSDYFAACPEVPIYFKLRTVLLQTLADLERRHLAGQGRDLRREAGDVATELAGDITTPVSRVDRSERHALLRQAVARLDEADRRIVMLRSFDGLSNLDCASILGLTPKAASMRYVRALERLKILLTELSCFRN